MKGKFFGYQMESPCSACGGPRFGSDCDDDYYISAGTLETVQPTKCGGEVLIPWDQYPNFSNYDEMLKARWASIAEAEQKTNALAKTSCTECGGKRIVIQPKQFEYHYTVTCWRSTLKAPEVIAHRIEGCAKCRESFSWQGIGLMAGD